MINVTLDNGAELTYCELGQDHQEILVTTAFYFHTFMPVVEELALMPTAETFRKDEQHAYFEGEEGVDTIWNKLSRR